jgi:hypothetical protein
MKQAKWLIVGVALMTLSFGVHAQNYWVIETNPTQTRNTVVKIYDLQNVLIHEEIVADRILDSRVKSDRKFLNRKLKEISRQKALASAKTSRTRKQLR